MPKKSKAEKPKEPAEEAVEVKKPEKQLPPVEYAAPPPCVTRTHPATLGYQPASTGTLSWDPARVSLVTLGTLWEPKTPSWSKDSRTIHPSTFGYHEDLAPRSAVDPAAFNPACISPIFAGPAILRNTVKPPKKELRSLLHVESSSAEGKYLDENVWPTLELGLEKLLNAVKYHVPKDVTASYPGGWDGPDSQRVTKPRHAVDFDPLEWLSMYLEWFNPNVPAKYTPVEAALKLQSFFRGYLSRKRVNKMRAVIAGAWAAEERRKLENKSATKIQALYRGHSVRLTLSLGMVVDAYDGHMAVRDVTLPS